jgi:ABC-2 type transport system permease protein
MLGLVATMIQQALLLYVATAITREKEQGTLGELLEQNYSATQVVLGKTAPYFLLNFLNLNFILAGCYYIFKIPFNGSIWNLLLMEVLFLGGITALGIFLSTACKSQLEATQLAMLFALPSFLFSGYTWPLESMPEFARGVAALFPLTYFAANLRDIALMDLQLPVMLKDIIVLGAINTVLLPAAILVFKKQYHQQ